MSGLWRNHPTTPRQQSLFKEVSRSRTQPTQADVLIAMLREARSQGRPLELPSIMQAGIAQHGARFNEIDRDHGLVRSRYRLTFDPESEVR